MANDIATYLFFIVAYTAAYWTLAMALSPLQMGLLIAVAVTIIYIGYKIMYPSVATGPSGGIVPSTSPAVTVPAVAPMIPYDAATVPVPAAAANRLTKYIILRKDVTDNVLRMGEASFQASELKVYADGVLLPKSAFANAAYTAGGTHPYFSATNLIDGNLSTFAHTGNTPSQEITVTLAKPVHVTSVEIHNRADCCQARLTGTKVILQDANRMNLWISSPLTSADVQTVKPIYVSTQGFGNSPMCRCGCPDCTCRQCANPYHRRALCSCRCRNCRIFR